MRLPDVENVERGLVQIDDKLLSRSVNEGFSGGEKKRHEIYQMAMLEPRLGILDETEDGLTNGYLVTVTHERRRGDRPDSAREVG